MRLAVSKKGIPRTARPTLKRKRCKRGHDLKKHGRKDSAGYLRCGKCLAESQSRYRAVTVAAHAKPRFMGTGLCPKCKAPKVGLVTSGEGPLCLDCHPTHERG